MSRAASRVSKGAAAAPVEARAVGHVARAAVVVAAEIRAAIRGLPRLAMADRPGGDLGSLATWGRGTVAGPLARWASAVKVAGARRAETLARRPGEGADEGDAHHAVVEGAPLFALGPSRADSFVIGAPGPVGRAPGRRGVDRRPRLPVCRHTQKPNKCKNQNVQEGPVKFSMWPFLLCQLCLKLN